MKKVLVYGMTDNSGGIETYLVNIALRLKGQVAFDYVTDFPDIAHRDTLEELGSKIHFIPAKSKGLVSHLKAFYRILKENREYDTVYFNVLDAGCAFTELIPYLLKRRIITHSHNSSTDKVRLHRLCKPFLKLFTDNAVACSALAAEYMFGNSNGVTLIPNAIDCDKFRFDEAARKLKRQELGLDGKTLICHIGRLSLQKNPFGMLDIFASVLKREPEAVLVSAGTGELEEEVKAYAEKIGVSESVLFLGKRGDISELLSAADVFFLPSFYEGLPIVAIEAQASGLFCVLSDSITKETDITGQVEFLSLKDTHDRWVNALLEAAKKPRLDSREKLIAAGYDLKHSGEADSILTKIFIGPVTLRKGK